MSRKPATSVRLPRPTVTPLDSSVVPTLRYLYEELTPTQFEYAVAELLRSQGYRDVQRVGGAGDRGVDITCSDQAGRSVAVQCKQYRPDGKVGSKDMQNFVGMITRFHRSDLGLFVTTAGYTAEAQTIAYGARVDTIDGPTLGRMYRPLLTRNDDAQRVERRGGHTGVVAAGIAAFVILLIGVSRLNSDESDVSPRIANVVATGTVTRMASGVPSSAPAESARFSDSMSARTTSTSYLFANVSGDRRLVAMLNTGTVVDITGPLVRDDADVSWLPVTVQRTRLSGYLLVSLLAPSATPVAEGSPPPVVEGLASPAPGRRGTPRPP